MDRRQRLRSAVKQRIKGVLRPLVQHSGTARPLGPEHWEIENDGQRGLVFDGFALSELVGRWGSPLHVVSGARLRHNVRQFTSPPAGHSVGCEVFYSYKSNPVPGVLALLHGAGVGAEVISAYELWLALRLGVPPAKILYNGPAKSPESIRQAIDLGIALIGINHREEIATIANIAGELKKRARVAVRVNAIGGWSAQFGVPIEGGAALAACVEAARTPWLELVGLHLHRGGMMRQEPELLVFVDSVLAFWDRLSERLGRRLEILDFGGSLGLPSVTALSARDRRLNQTFQRALPAPDPYGCLSVERYVSLLVNKVEEHCRAKRVARPRLFLEPGRAMTGNAQFLLARVLTIKRSTDTTYAILDAGINIAESVRSEYHQLLPVKDRAGVNECVYTIVGPICTPGDTLYSAIRLPELQCGDVLAIMDAGAYFVPFSTSFSFPRPAILLIDSGQERLLRRAECFEDLVAYDEPLSSDRCLPDG